MTSNEAVEICYAYTAAHDNALAKAIAKVLKRLDDANTTVTVLSAERRKHGRSIS